MVKFYGYLGAPRLVGLMNRDKFILGVSRYTRSSKNWVAQRISETGNRYEIEVMKANPNVLIEISDMNDSYKIVMD